MRIRELCGWPKARRATLTVCAWLVFAASAFAQAPTRVLVMPFENASHEGRIVWLGEASAVLLADDLNAFGIPAIGRDERRGALERLQVPQTASLTDATVIRIGQIVGASEVVVGTLRLDGDVLVVDARAIALETGKLRARISERGAIPDLFGIFERVARRIISPTAEGGGGAAPTHPPVAAFENYIKGLLAETPATAINYLNAALKADTKFDRARLALWTVYDNQGEHDRALAAVTGVPAASDAFRHARFLAGLSQLRLRRYDEAFATYKALLDARSSPAILNNLGVVQMRRGGTAQTGMPTYYFNKAAEGDVTEADYCFNLGYAYWNERNNTAAIYWLREAVRRNPADGDAHYVLGAALASAGTSGEAAREKELARRLSSAYADWDKRPAAEQVPKGLERLKMDVELPRVGRIDETLITSGQRDQVELARFYVDRAKRLYQQENDREALQELARALFLAPYLADAHLLVGRIHLRGGRTREAIDAFKISLWSADTAEAHAALASAELEAKHLDAARAEAERAIALDPTSGEARRVLGIVTAK